MYLQLHSDSTLSLLVYVFACVVCVGCVAPEHTHSHSNKLTSREIPHTHTPNLSYRIYIYTCVNLDNILYSSLCVILCIEMYATGLASFA